MALPSIYAFCGPEIGQRNEAVQNTLKNLQKNAPQVDTYTFYATESKLNEVVSLLQNKPLFADACFVELRNAEVIKKKEDIELISVWLKGAEETSMLVLTSDEISLDKKLENLVTKDCKKVFWEMFEDRKEQWLRSFFSKEGYSIEEDAIESVLELVENNTEALRAECSRFFLCFDKGHRVTQDNVENVLAHTRGESVFSLFDSLSDSSRKPNERLENALSILQKLRLSKDFSGVQFIAGLTYSFRKLAVWLDLHKNNHPSDFDLKIKGFSSKKAQSQYRRAQKLWGDTDVRAILAHLSKADYEIRSGGTTLENIQMQTLLSAIVFNRA